jgi:hypothetical protein
MAFVSNDYILLNVYSAKSFMELVFFYLGLIVNL